MTHLELAEALRHAREAAGLSYTEAAHEIGMLPSTYHNLEQGRGLNRAVQILSAFEAFGAKAVVRGIMRPRGLGKVTGNGPTASRFQRDRDPCR